MISRNVVSVIWVTSSGHWVGITKHYCSANNEKGAKTCLIPVVRIVSSDDQTLQIHVYDHGGLRRHHAHYDVTAKRV